MVKSLLLVLMTLPLFAQNDSDLAPRLTSLEEKMRQLDPSFTPPPAGTNLRTRLEALEKRIDEALLARQAPPPVSTSPLQGLTVAGDYRKSEDTETRLPVSGYMDFHFNKRKNEPGEFDFHRFVLLFGHSFSSRIKFWSEVEIEHAIVEGGEEKGELAVEQAYVDFLIKPWFNIRAGMLLTPIGIINERHEPPAFNGVERPFVETFIIPTTWREMGVGITGDLGRGFRYRAYTVSSLDATRFDAEQGIADGKTNGFGASFRNPAKVARLEYVGVRRLALGASIYSGHSGFRLLRLNPRVNIFDVDGRYSVSRFDFRALFANTWVSRAGALNQTLEVETGGNPNIASQMRGFYFEPAIHVFPKTFRHDMILFSRYEKYNTQQEMPAGFVPLPQFNRSSWVVGATYKPHSDVAVRFDYSLNRNASSVVRAVDSLNLGIGWWF